MTTTTFTITDTDLDKDPIVVAEVETEKIDRTSVEPTFRELLVETYSTRVEADGSLWAESPAGLRTLKTFLVEKIGKQPALLRQISDGAFAGLLTTPVCTGIYGLLWAIRRPICSDSDSDGPPSPRHLRNAIRSKGLVGRIYGYALVGWTHLLGYGIAWVFQRPAYLFNALLWVAALAYLIWR
jgi:hypothetical protein